MKYREIKAALEEYNDRFYRVVLAKENVSLYELGVILGTALGCEFEHMFMFRSGKDKFCDPAWIDRDNEYSYYDKKLEDLDKNFIFSYDTGDGWDFECRISDETFDMDTDKIAILEEGKGQGIWEDNKFNLMRYLDGEIDPDTDEEDEENGIYFPWNYDIERFSDFDTDFDLKFEQEDFAECVEDNLYSLKEARDEVSDFLPDNDDDNNINIMSAYDSAFDIVCEYIASYQIMTDDEVQTMFDDLKDETGEENAMRKLISVVKDELSEYIDNNEMLKKHSFFTKMFDIDDEDYN